MQPAEFYIYERDTLETVLDRYAELYPTEAKMLVAEIEDMLSANPEGWSTAKYIQWNGKIPDVICFGMKHIDNDFWKYEENYNKFFRLAPRLCRKGVKIGV